MAHPANVLRDLRRYWLAKGWPMRLVFLFDGLIVLLIAALPFLHLDRYNVVQLATLLLFLAMFALDSGFGRDGEAFGRHHGRRLLADHLVLWGLISLTVALAFSTQDPVFHWTWLAAAGCFALVYLHEASGFGPRLRARVRDKMDTVESSGTPAEG